MSCMESIDPCTVAIKSGMLTPGTVWTHHKGGVYAICSIIGQEIGYVSLKDGRTFYRLLTEFIDGRFEPVPTETRLTHADMGFTRG